MQIIQPRGRKTVTQYHHDFRFRENRGGGFRFDCDENGKLIRDKYISAEGLENYRKCCAGEYDVVDLGIEAETLTWVECAVGKCEECGAEVYLDRFTNTCECGADYNMSGHLLAPRWQWGEETGESVADILAADSDYEAENDYCR